MSYCSRAIANSSGLNERPSRTSLRGVTTLYQDSTRFHPLVIDRRLRAFSDRQRSNPDAAFLEDGDTSLFQRFLDSRQVHQKKRQLFFRMPIYFTTEQDHRRSALVSQREQRAEIGICRDDRPVLLRGARKDHLILGRLQAVIADMHSVMAMIPQPLRHRGRQRVIYEKSHGAAKGSSRSRTASAA